MSVSHTHERIIDVYALKNLFDDLSSARTDISVRLQMKNQPWSPHFASILVFAKHAIMFVHMPTRTVIHVPDLHEVQGFEINQEYKEFSAFRKYAVSHPHSQKQEQDGALYA